MTAPSSSRSAIISPSAQNRVPSRFWCQRSFVPRPVASADAISVAGRPMALSSGVKMRLAGCPSISASVQPMMRRAPSFQPVTRPSRSVLMMP